ncbi:orotidine-5'-phosphate decarboxylase [Acidihalobacter prosperus]|uniref:Orotidine 5'-phosphate decarboxylase n=1 Tax=Acidihalobacter prosperus TaxID=160660 RepID=A0A1A6C7E0_9GAMM|nr:orotidine-5'-phosphate decarboxylase [Acidihalobacter prosperus]OBS10483.1 Orotidine 5'-phosphate decarboxylase [Acidihalobacter prosperus]
MDSQRTIDGARVIVALDFPDAGGALALAAQLDPQLCRLKVGFELFVAAGPALVEALMARGFDVFLDLKFHDIPNTVASACRAAANLGVWMLNVHASGGSAMMQAARESIATCPRPPLLIAVTVLTSMDSGDLRRIGVERSAGEQVLELARLTQDCGLDGIVCSAQEARLLREAIGAEFLLVTPGIRPHDSEGDDQKRVLSPVEALRAGSDYLVVGRPITRAQDPLGRLHAISESLRAAE